MILEQSQLKLAMNACSFEPQEVDQWMRVNRLEELVDYVDIQTHPVWQNNAATIIFGIKSKTSPSVTTKIAGQFAVDYGADEMNFVWDEEHAKYLIRLWWD